MAPAARSLATTVASRDGARSAKSSEPAVVRTPAVSSVSLNVTGTPWSGPRRCPRASPISASRARASASSKIVTSAFEPGIQSLGPFAQGPHDLDGRQPTRSNCGGQTVGVGVGDLIDRGMSTGEGRHHSEKAPLRRNGNSGRQTVAYCSRPCN